MSDVDAATIIATLAAFSSGALAAALASVALRRTARARNLEPAPDPTAGRRVSGLPMALRVLRRAVARLAQRCEAQMPAVLLAPVDRELRRAGCADGLTATELLLLGVPPALVALLAGIVDADALWLLPVLLALIPVLSLRWVRGAAARREQQVLRELPFHLDMLALALESGATLLLALRSCTPRSPPGPLREALEWLTLELQTGRLRADALAGLQHRLDFDSITALTTAIREADRSGAGLARVLRIQADQRRHERFHRAEKLAMQAPVRMLGPLVLCIFPCTFIVIGFVLFVRVAGP